MFRPLRTVARSVPGARPAWHAFNVARRNAKVRYRATAKPLFKRVDFPADQTNLMVNIGAGQWWVRHWYNLDAPPGVRSYHSNFIDFPFDLCSDEPLPFDDRSVRLFYSSHTIEHLPQVHLEHMFRECFRSLKPGGAIRLTTPDFDKAADAYEAGDEEFFTKTCSRTGVGKYSYPWPEFSLEKSLVYYFAEPLSQVTSEDEIRSLYASLGRQGFADEMLSRLDITKQGAATGNVGSHVNWFTYQKLDGMLRAAGFDEIHKSARGQSHFREMREPETYFDESYPLISLYVEAVKR